MTILQVLYVLEVAQRGNVSKAAESLYVSQPALSLQIKRLEEELGCKLFRREPQGVSLTASGKVFCECAKPVAETWRRLQEGTKLIGNAVCKHVRIGIGSRAMSNGLFEAMIGFFERHPETEVTFITDLGGDVLEALEEKQVNLAIDRLPLDSMIRHRNHFFVFELLREQQCVLLSPKDPRVKQPSLHFRELHDSAIVSGPEGSLDDEIMKMRCEEWNIRVSKIHRADHIDAVMALVRSGKGAALGPASFSKKYGVSAVPMLPETNISLNLICLKQNSQNPLIQQICQHLKDCIAQRDELMHHS